MAMWMVRCESGRLYDTFYEQGVAALGWAELAESALQGADRQQLTEQYQALNPTFSTSQAISGAAQIWRFVNDTQIGDGVVTYSPQNRTYRMGSITSKVQYNPQQETGMEVFVKVDWQAHEIDRDTLSQACKNSLGSTLTIFSLRDFVIAELAGQVNSTPSATNTANTANTTDSLDDAIADPLANIEEQTRERIKDMIIGIDWSDMEHLVAGILRAMGYKTQVSPVGPDRGKDIVASPDGFGFENPRIVVEVKHRKGQMGADAIRSFLGGRHQDDRGLYVSTGGFSKDARYEADRANIPLVLWTADDLVRALLDNYSQADAETKRLVSLKPVYVPA